MGTTPSAMIDLSLFETNGNNTSYDDSHAHYEQEKEKLGGIQYEQYDENDDHNIFEQYNADEDNEDTYNNNVTTIAAAADTTNTEHERPPLSPSKSLRKMTKSFSSSRSMSLTS